MRTERDSSINYSDGSKPSRIRFLLWLFCLVFVLAGVQFVFSIQFAVGGPLFTDKLKISRSTQSFIFATAGPVAGFIAQPIVGVISDRSTSRFGRRRPFIVLGSIGCAIGMAMIGASSILGNLLGDNEHGLTASDHKIGSVFAISGLWIMNTCVNIVQGPARTLVADLVPEDEQQTGNAMVSLVMGFAAVVANVVGAQFLLSDQPYLWLFTIGVGFVLFSVIPTTLAAKEKRYIRAPGEKTMGPIAVFGQIFTGFRTMSKPTARILIVFFFSWAGYSPFMVYISNFFAVNVFDGNTTTTEEASDRYRAGVKFAMYSLAAFAGLQTVYSLIMPSIIKAIKIKPTYFLSQILAGGCLLSLFFVTQKWIVFALTILVAINFATFNSIPFGLVTVFTKKEDVGLYMGVLNSAGVVAQTLIISLSGVILNEKDQDSAWGIAFGAILSLFGAMLIWILPSVPTRTNDDEQESLLGDN